MSSRIFSTVSVVLLVLGCRARSSPTDTRQALKLECHSKTAVRLKECSLKPTKHFKGFGSGFTEHHAKLEADTLLTFAIHCSQRETRGQKSTCIKTVLVHRAVSRGSLMQ
jgi:hypothetical protein